jgi:ATP-binding cassette subfamily C protein
MKDDDHKATAGLLPSYWSILDGFRPQAVWIIVLTLISGFFETAGIIAIVPIVDSEQKISEWGIHLQGPKLRYLALIGFAGFAFLASGVRLLAERSIARTVAGLERKGRKQMTKAALEMDWVAYLLSQIGDLNTSLLLTINQIASGVTYFIRATGTLLVVILLGVVAVFLSWRLSVFTLLFGAAAVLTYYIGVRPTQKHTANLTDAASSLGSEADLLFGNFKLFRSLGARSSSEQRLNTIYDKYSEAYAKGLYVVPMTRSLFEVIGIFGIAAVLLGSLVTEHGNALSPASIAFLVLFLRLAPRLISTQESLQQARLYRRWCDVWWETLGTLQGSPMFVGGTEPPTFDQELRSDGLSFVYPGTTRVVLDDINWEIRPGEIIAFVGDSGAGKTTMVDLITGLMQPTSGAISVDGRDLKDVDIDLWQSRLGLVMQDPPILPATILENIYWTEADRDVERAERSLELADAKGFVDRLPDGVNTMLGQRGATLSGGERQRLAMARALYRQPWLLILDEPTSALDAESEREVLGALDRIKSKVAMVVIAHGLNPVRLADRIYVLSEGHVVEHGSWDELVAHPEGWFSKMVQMRSSSA